ncbi:response regulator [Pendulispora rubella]|uniref:Response regulator n=1 Tax=Pendulispora rubella TaxID=2741070 RepID=A0ABZ2KSN4_9BACT
MLRHHAALAGGEPGPMTAVLVVDDDLQFRETLVRHLTGQGFDVSSAQSVDEAITLLERRPADVVLTDLRLGVRDGIDLIATIRSRSIAARTILMSAFATARDYQTATELGAVRVLCKPFTPEDLLDAIRQAIDCSTGFRGSIHGLSLIDMLQMFHLARRSIVLHIGDTVTGHVYVQDGEVVHAEKGTLSGEPALLAILSAQSGSVSTSALGSTPRTIARSFSSLLLDLLRQIDESSLPREGERLELEDEAIGDWQSDEGEETMGKIDDACKEVVAKVDGAVACGVVDLDTGMLLGIHNGAAYTQTLNEIVAAATMDLFRGPNVGRIEQMVRAHRGLPENGAHYFQEIHITSEHNYHFAKTLKQNRAVIMLVTKKTTNIGLGWAQLKAVIPIVEPLVP